MTEATEELLQSVLALPQEERLQLVDALLAEWGTEIQRRSAEIDAGTAALTPWPEAKRRVRQRLEEGCNG